MVDVFLGSRRSCSLIRFLRNWELQCIRDTPFNWGVSLLQFGFGSSLEQDPHV